MYKLKKKCNKVFEKTKNSEKHKISLEKTPKKCRNLKKTQTWNTVKTILLKASKNFEKLKKIYLQKREIKLAKMQNKLNKLNDK